MSTDKPSPRGFAEAHQGRLPPSIAAPADFGSSAKLLEAAYLQSAARTGRPPKNTMPPATPGSALRSAKTPREWGAQRQKISVKSVQGDLEERLSADASARRLSSRVSFRQSEDEVAARAIEEAGGATFSSIGGEFGTADDDDDAVLVGGAADDATGHDEDGGYLPPPEDYEMAEYDDEMGGLSPTRLPGMAGELARAQALLADATAEQSRLEAELAYERERAGSEVAEAQAELERERARYRREVDFVRAGVDAAAAQRDAAAAKRKEAHERALKRAVKEAEGRTGEAAQRASASAEEAHHAALAEQAARYEKQLEAMQSQMIGLATEVQRLQALGAWPGGPVGPADPADAEDEDEVPQLDVATAHKVLATAIATVDAAAAAAGGG